MILFVRFSVIYVFGPTDLRTDSPMPHLKMMNFVRPSGHFMLVKNRHTCQVSIVRALERRSASCVRPLPNSSRTKNQMWRFLRFRWRSMRNVWCAKMKWIFCGTASPEYIYTLMSELTMVRFSTTTTTTTTTTRSGAVKFREFLTVTSQNGYKTTP